MLSTHKVLAGKLAELEQKVGFQAQILNLGIAPTDQCMRALLKSGVDRGPDFVRLANVLPARILKTATKSGCWTPCSWPFHDETTAKHIELKQCLDERSYQ